MNTCKRLFLIGAVVITLVISFLASIPKRVHWNQSYIPEELQEKLAQEGCFYNRAKDCYQIDGVDFGRELYETVADLGLQGWYTEENIDDIYQGLSGDCNSTFSSFLTVSAFDAKYKLFFGLSKSGECFQIGLRGAFVSESKTPIPYENVMDYGDACTYFYDLYNEFMASYGEPDISNFPINLSEIALNNSNGASSNPEVYACWITGEEGHQSVLRLSAKPIYTKDIQLNQVLQFNVYIQIGQEIDGISIDDLT